MMGGAPRELLRFEQPFRNHNGGQIGFNLLASPGDADFGLLYIGVADGGSGGGGSAQPGAESQLRIRKDPAHRTTRVQ